MNEIQALETLRTWRRGNTARVLVFGQGTVRLIEWRSGARFDADFLTAAAAARALEARNVHWQRRDVALGSLPAGRNWMGHLIEPKATARPAHSRRATRDALGAHFRAKP